MLKSFVTPVYALTAVKATRVIASPKTIREHGLVAVCSGLLVLVYSSKRGSMRDDMYSSTLRSKLQLLQEKSIVTVAR
jgi:hypothetical protein